MVFFLKLIEVIKESWFDFMSGLGVFKACAPFLIGIVIFEVSQPYLFEDPILLQRFIFHVCLTALHIGLTFYGLRFIYIKMNVDIELTSRKALIFILSQAYITLVTGLGFFLLFFPGVMITSLTCLAPIYVLKDNQGPIEAIVSSVKAIKPVFIQLSVLFLFLLLFFMSVVYFGEYLFQVITEPNIVFSVVASLMSIVFMFYSLFFIVNVYQRLQESSSELENL